MRIRECELLRMRKLSNRDPARLYQHHYQSFRSRSPTMLSISLVYIIDKITGTGLATRVRRPYGKPSVPKLLLRHHNRNDVILHPILRRRHITSLCCIIATTEMMSYYIFCQTRHMTSQTSYDILAHLFTARRHMTS